MGRRTVVITKTSKLDYSLGYMVVRDVENTVKNPYQRNIVFDCRQYVGLLIIKAGFFQVLKKRK